MAAATEVTAIQESELAEVRRFLFSIYDLPPDHRPFRLDALRWKAFDPHPEYPGSRSFVVRHENRIVAHGILSPLRFRGPDQELAAQCLMDWAADPSVPGVGVMVYQHLASFADVQIAIGGSDDARKMLPLLAFRPKQQMRSYRLITSAWKYHLGSGHKDWKTPLRLGRDWARSRNVRVKGSSSGIEAKRIDRFEGESLIPLPDPRIAGCMVSARTTASLNYALRCPIAGMEAYLLMRLSETLGYFILARVDATCRIGELWINSESAQDWLNAVELATETAAAHPDTGAVFTTVSAATFQSALEQIGYQSVEEVPVFLKDRQRRVPPEQPILLSMLENDAFYF
jgi:hypothetical protein